MRGTVEPEQPGCSLTFAGCLWLMQGMAILRCAGLCQTLLLCCRCAQWLLPTDICGLFLEAAVDAQPQNGRLQRRMIVCQAHTTLATALSLGLST